MLDLYLSIQVTLVYSYTHSRTAWRKSYNSQVLISITNSKFNSNTDIHLVLLSGEVMHTLNLIQT